MMIATSAVRLIGPSLESRVAPTKRSDAMDRARLELRSAVEGSGASGDDVGRQLVLKVGDPILQGELALLQTLDLQLIPRNHALQCVDRHIQIAMFLLEAGQVRFQFSQFGHLNYPRCQVVVGRRARGAELCSRGLWRASIFHGRFFEFRLRLATLSLAQSQRQ